MSGFDGLFRTQALTGQWHMDAARRRESARQFDVSAAQGQQGLMMRGLEVDAKLGAWQQEQQLNAIKLEQMQGIDQAKMSRIATEGAELDLEARRIELDQAKKNLAGGDPEHMKVMAQIREIHERSMGSTAEERLKRGYIPSPEGWRRAANDQELQAYATKIGGLEKLMGKGDPLARNRLGQELDRVLGPLTDPVNRAILQRVAPDVLRALEGAAGSLGAEYGAHFQQPGGGQPVVPPGGETGPTTAAPAPSSGPPGAPQPVQNPYQPETLAGSIWGHDRWTSDPFWSEIAGETNAEGRPIARDVMAYVMAKFGPGLAEHKGWRGQIDALMFSAAENDPQVLGFLLKATPIGQGAQRPDADIRRVLRHRFQLTPGALDFTMKSIDRTFDWLLQKEAAEAERERQAAPKPGEPFEWNFGPEYDLGRPGQPRFEPGKE